MHFLIYLGLGLGSIYICVLSCPFLLKKNTVTVWMRENGWWMEKEEVSVWEAGCEVQNGLKTGPPLGLKED